MEKSTANSAATQLPPNVKHGAEEMTLASLVQVVAIAAILVMAVFAVALAAKAVF